MLYEDDHLIGNNGFCINLYLDILSRYDDFYIENWFDELIERLKHGYLVHFTTNKCEEIIKKAGVIGSTNYLIPEDLLIQIQKIISWQALNETEKYNNFGGLSLGFSVGKGLSMGSQTREYWNEHTPECLSFLFGSNVYKRDKVNAMKDIEKLIEIYLNMKKLYIIYPMAKK